MKRRSRSLSSVELAQRLREEACRIFFELSPPPAEDKDKNPRWMQIARTGLWKGYHGKRTIEFTVDTFNTIIANFHDHPTYKAAAKGKGTTDVVPCDFNHASEMDPTEGSLPVVGAPAQAWIQELELRAMPDGKTGLWAYTRLLEPVATYVKESKIKWTSVTVWPNAIDPESGKEIGPLLTSVAFTNQPFIEGMVPIAANRAAELRRYYDAACDAEDAFMKLRDLFGLSQTAAIGDLLAEIGKLRVWISSGTVPMGVDTDDLVSSMRTILGMPALSSTDDVFAELDKLLPAMIEQEALEATEGAPDMPSSESSASVTEYAPLGRNRNMTLDPKLLATLASTFGIVANTEEAISAAARELVTDGKTLRTLFKAMGVTDADGAAAKLADLLKAQKDLEELRPKHTALLKRVEEIETNEAKTEVIAAMKEHGLSESLEEVLLDFRVRKPEEFRKKYPVTPPEKQHLTRSLFANSEGAQLGSERTGAGHRGNPIVAAGGGGDIASQVDGYPGRNRVEQCMAFIRGTVPGAKEWAHEDVHAQACELNRRLGPPAQRQARA